MCEGLQVRYCEAPRGKAVTQSTGPKSVPLSVPYLLDMLQEADDCGNVVRWISLLGHEVTRHLLGAMGGEREPNPAVANSGSSTRTCQLSVLLTALPIILAHLKMEDSSRWLHIPPQPSRGRHPCAKRSHCDAHRLAPCRGHRVHGLRQFCLFRIKTLRAQRLN